MTIKKDEKKSSGNKARGKEKSGESKIELHPVEKQAESVFRFSNDVARLLLEAKAKRSTKPSKAPKAPKAPKALTRKDGTADKRSPIVKSIIIKKYPGTNGMHPTQARVLKQIQALNGKPRVSVKPVTTTKIAQPQKLFGEGIETLKGVLSEYNERAYNTSGWNRSRHGKTRGLQPGNRPDRSIVKTAKHEDKEAKALTKRKVETYRARLDYAQAQKERDAEIKQVTKLT